jgi:hypothetical protein
MFGMKSVMSIDPVFEDIDGNHQKPIVTFRPYGLAQKLLYALGFQSIMNHERNTVYGGTAAKSVQPKPDYGGLSEIFFGKPEKPAGQPDTPPAINPLSSYFLSRNRQRPALGSAY